MKKNEEKKEAERPLNLSAQEIHNLSFQAFKSFNETVESRDTAYYRYLNSMLLTSSTVFTVASTVSLYGLQHQKLDFCCILSSRTFLLLALVLFSGAILFSLIALREQIKVEKSRLRRIREQIHEPGRYMTRYPTNGSTYFFEAAPLGLRKIFFFSLQILFYCFVGGIVSLLVSVFMLNY
jgi:hypothetical protein